MRSGLLGFLIFVAGLMSGFVFTAQADEASLVVVTGRQSRLRDVPMTYLLQMFRGETQVLPDGSPASLVLSSAADNRDLFYSLHLRASEKIFLRHWQNLVFKGKASRIPAIPTSVDAIKMLFASDPRTVAVIGRDELSALGNLVRTVNVDGIDPGSDKYPLKKSLPAS